MGRKANVAGEPNKSQAIRDLLKESPTIKAKEAIAALGEKGIEITDSLFYLVKGKVSGGKQRRRKIRKAAVKAVAASGNGVAPTKDDALKTILKVKSFAAEVGGLRSLKALVDALSQ